MAKVRIAIVGVGNCASSLIQGIEYYRQNRHEDTDKSLGLMHYQVGPYSPADIEVVAAFDIDKRKVGQPLTKAIFAPPNCTKDICTEFAQPGPIVQMGPINDGVSEHMARYPDDQAFRPADAQPVDVAKVLRESQADILVNYLPVGSQKATEYYAEAALQTGVSLVNCIPVFIVSNEKWAQRFAEKGIPCVGDDIKAQVGATIVHRILTRLFRDRGAQLDATYQLNTAGNTDFLNMLNQDRLASKKISKTEAVQSQLDTPLHPDQVHIGPADYVPWQKDNKVCFLRMEGRGFAGIPLNLELRLSVEDSPNSAGVSIDAIRCCKVARDRGIAGPLLPVSAYLMKHPPVQMVDNDARRQIEEFISQPNTVKTAGITSTAAASAPADKVKTS
ncbi:MAG: inositol-3-phosphate synthase [Sedimentisphaerales bacterium]|nr:inositol-3-phosphate synthase [Sedimentisphaerales bacterium]